jgi:hypothetical protein
LCFAIIQPEWGFRVAVWASSTASRVKLPNTAWPQRTSITVAPSGVGRKRPQDPATSGQVCPLHPLSPNRTIPIPAAACKVLRLGQAHLTLPCSQELAAAGPAGAEDASIGLDLPAD